MRTHRLPVLLAALAATAALALPAAADPSQLSDAYRQWGEGPAQWLMTSEEQAEWNRLSSDQEAEQFIRLFWARRDPTPDTDLNETRRDFEQRAAYADQHFGTSKTPGSMTDRGQVLILLGTPKRVQRPGAGGSATGGDAGAGDSPFDTGGSVAAGPGPGRFGTGGSMDRAGVASEERWIYEDDRVPDFVNRKRFQVRFLSKPGTEEIELAQASDVLGYLAAAKREAVTRPELTVADLAAAPSAAAAAAPGTMLAYRGEELPAAAVGHLHSAMAADGATSVAAHLDAGAFQAGDGRWIVPVQVAVAGAPPSGTATVVGELVAADGDPRLAFRFEQPWQESRGQHYVKDTLVVPEAGDYELHAGLESSGGDIVWTGSEHVAIPAASDAYWLSELVMSDNIYPMKEAQEMLEPWAWQGIAVVPKAGATFPQGGLMWFYTHACNPSLGEDGEPSLRVQAVIDGPAKFRAPMQVQPAKAGDRCWVIASGIDVLPDSFPAGDYTVKLQVRDTVAGETLSTAGAFTVVEP